MTNEIEQYKRTIGGLQNKVSDLGLKLKRAKRYLAGAQEGWEMAEAQNDKLESRIRDLEKALRDLGTSVAGEFSIFPGMEGGDPLAKAMWHAAKLLGNDGGF